MNIIISGLGIIGGSFAKALAKYTDHHIIGINRSEKPLQDALACLSLIHIFMLNLFHIIVNKPRHIFQLQYCN